VEADIAERLGVSRTPVREAIHRLYQEGFLAAMPTTRRTELRVAPLTRVDLLDLYRLMGALEGTAAQGVGALDAAGRRALVRDLKTLEDAFEAAAQARRLDYDRVFEAHNAFHDRVVSAGATPRLRGLLDVVRPQVERYEWVYAPLVGPDYSATFSEHAAIIRAVRDEDGPAVRAAVVANWEQGAERLAAVIEFVGERGDWGPVA
jgi:DNA-binding GntR family transcriptional regulator